MSVSENLQDIIIKQKAVLAQLEKEAGIISRSDLTAENESLKKELQKLQTTVAEQSERLNAVTSQNSELKNTLHEQIYSEQLQVVNMVTEAGAKISKETGAFSSHSSEQFEKLKSEQITDDVAQSIGNLCRRELIKQARHCVCNIGHYCGFQIYIFLSAGHRKRDYYVYNQRRISVIWRTLKPQKSKRVFAWHYKRRRSRIIHISFDKLFCFEHTINVPCYILLHIDNGRDFCIVKVV